MSNTGNLFDGAAAISFCAIGRMAVLSTDRFINFGDTRDWGPFREGLALIDIPTGMCPSRTPFPVLCAGKAESSVGWHALHVDEKVTHEFESGTYPILQRLLDCYRNSDIHSSGHRSSYPIFLIFFRAAPISFMQTSECLPPLSLRANGITLEYQLHASTSQ